MSSHSSLLRIACGAMLLATSACTTIGEKEFSCPGRPQGVSCLSATQVYKETDASDTVKSAVERKQKTKTQTPAFIRAGLALPTVDKPIPVRTPAQVMRVWTAPWEDARGVLHAGGYHFVEVQSRRWNFGESTLATEPVRFFSIQSAPLETKKKQEPGGKTQNTPGKQAQANANDRPRPSTVSSTSAGVSK